MCFLKYMDVKKNKAKTTYSNIVSIHGNKDLITILLCTVYIKHCTERLHCRYLIYHIRFIVIGIAILGYPHLTLSK